MLIFLGQLLLISLVGGISGGMFGFSSGAIVVPAMVMLGLNQKLATGTYIAAQILPIGLLGANVYYRSHNINILYAILIAVGMTAGNLLGALFSNQSWISDDVAKKLSGVMLLILATRYLGLGFWAGAIASLPLLNQLRRKLSQFKKRRSHSKPLLLPQATELTPDFILQCEQELTDLIGPIAPWLVQQVLQAYPQLSPIELVLALSHHVPDAYIGFEFQRRLGLYPYLRTA